MTALLDIPMNQAVLGLAAVRGVVAVTTDFQAFTNAIGGPFGEAPIQDLPLGNQIVHGADGFVKWRLGVEAVALVEIEVVGSEPLEARMTRFHDVLARQALVVGPLGHGEKDFAGQHV